MSSPAALGHVQKELYTSLLYTLSLKLLTFTVFLSVIDVSSDYVQGYLLYQANRIELYKLQSENNVCWENVLVPSQQYVNKAVWAVEYSAG